MIRARGVAWWLLLVAVGACDDGGGDPAPATDMTATADAGAPDGAMPADQGVTQDEGVVADDGVSLDEGLPPDMNPMMGCAPDPDALAEALACVRDEQCPCASHCSLGRCVRACIDDGECADGEACDRFGRCRAAAVIARNPLAAREPIGGGQMLPARLYARLPDAGETTSVQLRARGPVGAVRIVAPPGLQVAAPDGEFADEVVLDGPFADGEAVEVEVMADEMPDGMDDPDAPAIPDPTLQVYTDSNEGSAVSVGRGPDLPLPEPAVAPPVEGEYRGFARLVRSGFADPRTTTLEREFSVPLTARVYPVVNGGTPLEIHDPLGILHPDGRWVGAIRFPAVVRLPYIELPAVRWLPRHMVAGLPSEVMLAPPGRAELDGNPRDESWDGVLRATVPMRLAGVGLGTSEPVATWSIALQRVGDLPPEAERAIVDADARLGDDPATVTETRFPLEEHFMDAIGPAEARHEESALALTLSPDGTHRPEACHPPTTVEGTFAAYGAVILGEAADPDEPTDLFIEFPLPGPSIGAVRRNPEPFVAGLANAVTRFFNPIARVRNVRMRWQAELAPFAFTRVDGSPIPKAVPCALDLTSNGEMVSQRTRPDGTPLGEFDFSETVLDACTARAAAGVCSPTSVAHMPRAERLLPPASLNFDIGDVDAGVSDLEVVVNAVCVIPERPARCAEGVLCNFQEGPLSTDTLGRFSGDAHPVSGDLTCLDDVGMVQPLDDEQSADMLLAACEDDLAAMAGPGIEARDALHLADRLDHIGWNADHGCLNPVRFIGLLGLASERARQAPYSTALGDPMGDLITARLLQRWLEVHALLASEAGKRSYAIDPGEGPALRHLEERLAMSLAGWRLFFVPRIGTALGGLAPEALYDPDYRTRVLDAEAGGPAGQTLGQGLIVTMAETLTSQMELTAAIVERRARAGERTVDPTIREALRTFIAADALLRGLLATSRMVEHEAAPRWAPLADRARGQTQRILARLMLQLDAMVRGTNPLGIEEADLPLYFSEIESDAGSRFAAISTHILGDGPDSNAWAPSLVRAALDAFDAAREATAREEARLLNAAIAEDDRADRIEEAYRDLGATVQDLCGPSRFESRDPVVIGRTLPDDFGPQACWFSVDDIACQAREEEDEGVDPADAEALKLKQARNTACTLSLGSTIQPDRYQACLPVYGCANVSGRQMHYPVLRALQRHILREWSGTRMATAAVGVPAATTTIYIDTEVEVIPEGSNPCRNEQAPEVDSLLPEANLAADGETIVLTCAPGEGFDGPTWEVELTAADFEPDIPLTTWEVTQTRRACDAWFPREAPLDLSIKPGIPSDCYSGAIGTEVAALRGLATDVAIAQSELDALVDAYEISMRSCYRLQEGNQALLETTEAFVEVTNRKLTAREAWQHVAIWAGTAGDCLDSLAGAGPGWQLLAGGGACATHVVGGVAESVALNLETQMERLALAHDQTMAAIEQATDEDRCFIEAELALVDANTARLTIQRAIEELSAGYVALRHTIESSQLEIDRARADIVDAEEDTVRLPGRDVWLDRDLSRYRRALRLARRATYLAVRAVEYEFQANLLARGDALTADHPDDLEAVLQTLREVTATRQIEGARAAELTQIFSLRDHLLQLDGRESDDPSEQTLTAEERFRLYLTDPRFEIHEGGVFMGRLVPFRIAPLGELARGQSGRFPIADANSCAERLWSLNVAIQGNPLRTQRGESRAVDVQVLQRNTFYSNWCGPADTPFQVGSVRPGRNLFREPGIGEGVPVGGGDPTQRFARARIQAELDVPPDDFDGDAFTDGQSTELAARALYGDYALYIPATSLAPIDASGEVVGDGLILDEVDDILLRVDYLSVAR